MNNNKIRDEKLQYALFNLIHHQEKDDDDNIIYKI